MSIAPLVRIRRFSRLCFWFHVTTRPPPNGVPVSEGRDFSREICVWTPRVVRGHAAVIWRGREVWVPEQFVIQNRRSTRQ